MESDPICSSAGCTQYKQPEGPPQHPMDYFVPNFGMDKHDVLWTAEDEKVASIRKKLESVANELKSLGK